MIDVVIWYRQLSRLGPTPAQESVWYWLDGNMMRCIRKYYSTGERAVDLANADCAFAVPANWFNFLDNYMLQPKITFSVINPSSCVNRLERQVLAMCTMCLQLCRRNVFANNKQDVFASFSNVCRPFPPRSPNQSKRCWNILIIYISAFLLRVFTSTKHTPSDWILKR